MAEGGEPASNGPPVSNVSKDDETKASNVRHRGARNFSSSVGSAGETHTVVERENCTVNEYHRYMMISKLRLQGGKHDEAIKYFKQALECGRQAKGIDDPDVLDAHLRFGELCLQYRCSQDAMDALLRALEILERSDNPTRQRLWQCHDFLAQTYANFNEPQKEIEHYEKAIQCLSESTTPPPERLAQMHNNAGNAYEKLGKQALNDAMQHFQKAKDVMESLRLHESRNMIKVHLSVGNVYKALDKPELAIFELERSIKVSETTHPTEEKRRTKTRLTLIQLYNSTENTAKAKEHEKKLQSVEAAGTSGYPQPLSVTMGGGEESLGNSRPQDLTGSDAPFTYISNSSNQTASFPSLKSDSSGGSNSLHRHPEGAVAASNQGAVEGAPPLERRPPSEDSIPPKDDTAPGNLSLSERQSTGMEVPQGHVPVAPIASEQHQLPIQILNNGSALLTTGFAHTVVEDITVEPPAPVTREFDDVAHEDIAPVNEGGPFHQVQEVIIDPPSENQSLSSELASNSLDGQPCTRGMTEQAVENQRPLSVNGIQQHGMPAQVNWTTARQEGEYEVPIPEQLPVISPQSGPAGAYARAPDQPVSVILPNAAVPGTPAPNEQDVSVQRVVPASVIGYRNQLVTGSNISTATEHSSRSFSLDKILATSLRLKDSIPDTSSADRQQIEPETKSTDPRSLHLLGSIPESHAQTQFGPEGKSKSPPSLHLPESIPDSSLTSADGVKRKVSQLQEHSSPDHGLTEGAITHTHPPAATNQESHEERHVIAYLQALDGDGLPESCTRAETEDSKRDPVVGVIKGLTADPALHSTISLTYEDSSNLGLSSILEGVTSTVYSNHSFTPVVVPEATDSASSVDGITQAGILTEHPYSLSDGLSVSGDAIPISYTGYIDNIQYFDLQSAGKIAINQSYHPAFSHSPALTGVEFLQSSVRPKSMFSVAELDKLSRRPDQQKLKKGNDFMGLARENVTEYPEDAQQYCETAFESYSMMNPKGPEAQMDMTKHFIVAIQAYFNGQKFEEALDYVQAAEKLQPTNPEDQIEVLKLKAAILDAQGKAQEAQECRERISSVQ